MPRINTTTYGKHGIRYIGPVIWSNLSIHVMVPRPSILIGAPPIFESLILKKFVLYCNHYDIWASEYSLLFPPFLRHYHLSERFRRATKRDKN